MIVFGSFGFVVTVMLLYMVYQAYVDHNHRRYSRYSRYCDAPPTASQLAQEIVDASQPNPQYTDRERRNGVVLMSVMITVMLFVGLFLFL